MQNSVSIVFNPRSGSVNYFSIGIRYTRKLEIRYCARSRTIAYIGFLLLQLATTELKFNHFETDSFRHYVVFCK